MSESIDNEKTTLSVHEIPGELRLAGVIRESIVDGPGLRFAIFCQGCPHGCEGCHNPETHDFEGGFDCTIDRVLDAVDKNPLLAGVTFSGGEPMCQAEGFYHLGTELKKRGLNLMCYSGWTYEELLEKAKDEPYVGKLLDILDYLVDGRFVLAERDLSLTFRGSRNQRFIDLNKTREAGEVVLAE